MSNMVGADIGELRELAATFNARAAQLKAIESQLNWRIHSAPWKGHDVSRFVHDWNTRHRRVIQGAAASITVAAQELLANAEQQEQTSTAGYTGGIASVAAIRSAEQRRVQQNPTNSALGWISSVSEVGATAAGKIISGGATVDGLVEVGSSIFKDATAQVAKFIDGHVVPTKTLKLVGNAFGIAELGIDSTDFLLSLPAGNVPGSTIKGIEVGFGAVGFLGPWGAGASLFYNGLSWFRDNTPVGQDMARHGADIGQGIWDWGAGTARSVQSIVQGGVGASVDVAGTVANGFTDVLVDTAQATSNVAQQTVDASIGAVNSAGHFVTDSVGSAANYVKSVIKIPSWNLW